VIASDTGLGMLPAEANTGLTLVAGKVNAEAAGKAAAKGRG
jgi:hypothetical protein